ncbi:MAG: hypothetical protein Tsb0020_00420 [Haliangiales bacterium]
MSTSFSNPTVTWRTSPSQLSVDQLRETADNLRRILEEKAAATFLGRDIDLQQDAKALSDTVSALSRHLRYQRLLANISNQLLNLSMGDIEMGVTSALTELGIISNVERAYVFLLSEDGQALADAYEWTKEGVMGHDFSAFRGTPVTAFPWSMEQFLRGETVFVEDPESLPPVAAPERGACEALTIVSYVNMPLFAGGRLIGWLGFDSTTEPRTWNEEELQFMMIASDTIANAVERKRREEALFRQRELSQRVASMGTLAAGLAHEINNPLTFVVGNLSYIRELIDEHPERIEGEDISDLKESVSHAHEGADRVRRIVGDLRALALGESSETESVDLPALLDSTLRMASNQLRHRAQVVSDYRDVPAVSANASQLGQVLLNLVLNAAEAIPEGRADANTITITAKPERDAVCIQIRDTGRGIPADVLPRVFDPFFTTRNVGEGMGMGLSICYHLVRSFGGTIDITSEVGAGSCVTLHLPCASGDTAAPDAAPEAPSKQRILIVDDEPLALALLNRVLKKFDVVQCENGREAIDQLSKDNRFDLIFCDVMMPEATGRDVYQYLKQHAPGKEENIVFISGGTFTREMAEFLASITNEQLRKPFETKAIRELIEARLSDQGAADVTIH